MDVNELSGWGISQQIAQIIEDGFVYDEETGEVFFTTDDLDALNEALDKKIESLAGVYQMYNSKATALKERGKEVVERAKTFENKAERIKEYINQLMQMNGKTKLEVGDKKISYRKSVAGNITDEAALLKYIDDNNLKDKYLSYSKPTIAKKAIGDDIKATKQSDGTYALSIPGFNIVENNNIIIK